MKKFLTILIFFSLATTGCFFFDQAETIEPGDEVYNNPAIPPGDLTSLTAAITGPTLPNKVINIEFDTPVNPASVLYDTTVIIRVNGIPISEGAGYNASPDPLSEAASVLNLSITAGLSPGDTVRVILTSGITADADTSVTLTPITQDFSL